MVFHNRIPTVRVDIDIFNSVCIRKQTFFDDSIDWRLIEKKIVI